MPGIDAARRGVAMDADVRFCAPAVQALQSPAGVGGSSCPPLEARRRVVDDATRRTNTTAIPPHDARAP
jgi:hypothetical protein